MKLIILDHLRRWWLVWIAVGIGNYFITGSFQYTDQGSSFNAITFQVIFWLGAFELIMDLQRGSARVLTTLPASAKQIGRAWWVFSVALPTLFLAASSSLTMFIQSAGTAKGFPANQFIVVAITDALYFGSVFYLLIGAPGRPQTPVAFAGLAIRLGFILGMLFVKPTLNTIQGTVLLVVTAGLTVTGWFRAEQMVLQRASFRLVASASDKKIARHKTPKNFGGLPYLALRAFIFPTITGLAIMTAMILFMAFSTSGLNRATAVINMIGSGSPPYVCLMLMVSIVPLVFQLRFLRTLPFSSSTLAVTFVFLPVFSVAAVGVIILTITSVIFGETIILPTVNCFLMLGAKIAIMVSVVVWRGLDAVTYILVFLVMVADIFIKLGLTIHFHLGSNTPEQPLWINLIILTACVLFSLVMTHRLLIKSSSAYRVRTMPANNWIGNLAQR